MTQIRQLIALTLIAFAPSLSSAKACEYDLTQPQVLHKITRNGVEIRDPNEPSFYAKASVKNRRLGLDFDLRSPTQRSILRGSEVFQFMVNHYAGQFDVIVGDWFKGDNLGEFNRQIKIGKSETEAAALTFTGRQAALAGFTKVKIVEKHQDWLGRYTEVKVYFSRPEN